MNVCGVTFGGYLAKKLSFKLGNLLYKSNFYLLSEDTVGCTITDTPAKLQKPEVTAKMCS